jgi:hypothetical protein
MIDRTEKAFGAKPERLAVDTAYGTGKMLAWLLGKGIIPHIPVWERYQRTGHLDQLARDMPIGAAPRFPHSSPRPAA